MIETILAIIFGLGAVASFLYGLWLFIPILYGLPYTPTRPSRIRRALELAEIRPGEVVYDLGAGDGRVLVQAARKCGARGVGIEISPLQCAAAWLNVRRGGLAGQVRIRWQNLFQADLAEADVVFVHLVSGLGRRLQPNLERQLRPGARVVTILYDLEGWQPQEVDRGEMVFLYRMPPTPGDVSTFMLQNFRRGV